MSLLLCLQKSKNADFSHLRVPDFGLDQSAHRLNLRPRAWLLRTERELASALHQSFMLAYLHTETSQTVFHHIAWAYRAFALLALGGFASHAPEFKGLSPQRARGRERLSRR